MGKGTIWEFFSRKNKRKINFIEEGKKFEVANTCIEILGEIFEDFTKYFV